MFRSKFAPILPFVLISLVIFILSSLPRTPDLNQVFIGFDKLLHLIIYFVYGLSIIIFVIAYFPQSTLVRKVITVILIGVIFAGMDEIYQSTKVERFSELLDFVADLFGIILSLIFFKKIENLLKKNKNDL